jgi:dipeptidyl aminopeptidase/acylaminoacyl peptidase
VANSFSPGVREPRLSPDGRTALFVAYVDDESRLMLVDTDGSNPRPVGALGQPGAVALEPRFSADGTRIFVGSVGGSVILDRSDPSTEPPLDPVDTLDIFSVRLDGSDAVNLTNTPDRSEVMLDVAPDGSRIMFGEVGQHSGGVVLAKPDGSDPTEYAIPPALTPGYAYYSVSHVSFRPDGQGLAYALRYYCRSGPKKCPPSTLVNTGLDFSTPVAAGAGPVGFLSDWAPAATDVTSPATTLDQPRVVDGTPVTRAHSDDPGARFQCRLDQKPDEFCSGSPLSLPEVRPGRHQLCVKAVDPVGNVDATPACRGFKAPKD